VGQVGGTAELANPATPPSALEFAVVPGGNGATLLTAQGTLRANQIAAIARYTVMSFHSMAGRVRRDGRLELSGELTVTHVTRELDMGRWNWAYSGSSTYSDPQSKTITRPAKFVVMSPHAEFLPTYLKDEKEIVVAATMEAHDFPELPGIILDSDWPTVAEEENCPPPPVVGPRSDYAGVTCSGKAISVTNPASEHHSFSVDYSGMRRAVAPVDGPVTIVLHLRLTAPPADTPAPPK